MAAQPLSAVDFPERALSPGWSAVTFVASWCPHSAASTAVMDDASNKFPGVRFFNVDIDRAPSLALRFMIRSVPTLIIMKDGDIRYARVGAASSDEIAEVLSGFVG